MEAMERPMAGVEESPVEVGEIEDARDGKERGGTLPPAPSREPFSGAAREGEQEQEMEQEMEESEVHEQDDLPGGEPEPADEEGWQVRAKVAEERVAELGDRLGAVEAAAEDLRRIIVESEQARLVDRELLIAGVVDLDGARGLVDEQLAVGATVAEAVARVKERRPLLFVARGRGIRATVLPAVEGERGRSVDEVAEAARETGDRRLLLRYLRMRRGDRD